MTDFLGDPAVFLQRLVFQIPALLIAVTVHELAHALVADRLGDPTARRLGRITLNPLPHIDPLGAVAFVIAGFGWAKPVPVNAANLRHPRRDMAWVAAAGPLSNFLVAFLALAILRFSASQGPDIFCPIFCRHAPPGSCERSSSTARSFSCSSSSQGQPAGSSARSFGGSTSS